MKRFILVTICLIGGVFLAQQVLALTISPVKVEFSPNPGDLIESELLLINEEKETKTFYSSFENFRAKGEGGQPEFIPEKTGLASWIETAPQVTLKQGEQKTIPFSIRIPQDAEPGGHFAAIFWGTAPPEREAEGVTIGAKTGMLVLLKVSGEVKEEGKLLEFNTENSKRFFSHLPITLTFRFENTGNVQLKPEGEIEIKNIFGKTSAILPANKVEGNVLPRSIRKFEVIWEGEEKDTNIEETQSDTKTGFFGVVKKQWKDFHFGRYTANLNLTYGIKNETAQARFSFFIIPWQLLIVVIILLAVIVIVSGLGIKKYNQWIIAKTLKERRVSEENNE